MLPLSCSAVKWANEIKTKPNEIDDDFFAFRYLKGGKLLRNGKLGEPTAGLNSFSLASGQSTSISLAALSYCMDMKHVASWSGARSSLWEERRGRLAENLEHHK